MSLQKIDIAAAIIASIMVAGLAIFFSKTRIGRALRAVADSHKAALAVGISLEQIWVIVWFASGLVALVTGIMWGARSEVSFALQVIALRALPVLILGGFTSIPGAIVGRPDHRHRREARRFLLGPADSAAASKAGSPISSRSSSCCSGRKACSARRSSSASEGSRMLYREVGQFKTSYASDQAVFPILQDRIGIVGDFARRVLSGSLISATASCCRR